MSNFTVLTPPPALYFHHREFARSNYKNSPAPEIRNYESIASIDTAAYSS